MPARKEKVIIDKLNIPKDLIIKGVNVDEAIIALANSGVSQAALAKLQAVARSAPEINSLPIIAAVDFTETAGPGTYTGSVAIPAGAFILDVMWANTALWTAQSSAAMDAGDVADPNGIFAAVNVKSAPGVGAFLSYQRKDTGVGAYAGNKLLQYATADVITATVVTEGAAGTAGRSKLIVVYVLAPTAGAAVKA